MDDAGWDAFRSQKRTSVSNPPFAPWMVTALQTTKLMIFVFSHLFLVFGAAFSKIVCLVLATNLEKYNFNAQATPLSTACPINADRSERKTAAIHLALYLIQTLPDISAIVHSLWKIFTIGKGEGATNLTLIFLECCRGLGLSLLFMVVFPEIDLLRCVFLMGCLPIVPLLRSLLGNFARSMRPDRSLARRLIMSMNAMPSLFILLLLASGTYLWAVLETGLSSVSVLPIAVIITSLGCWESWIVPAHYGTYFHHLYQIKYGIRKMNARTCLVASMMRAFLCTVVFLCVLESNEVKGKQIAHILTHWSRDFKHTNMMLLALGVVLLNFTLRLCARFLAAMKMKVLPFLHPTFIVSPIVLFYASFLCYYSPDCDFTKMLGRYGLSWRCSQWSSGPKPFDDFYICILWLVVSMYKGYQLASSPEFEKCEDVIESMPPIVNGFLVEQGLLVFQHSVGKHECGPNSGAGLFTDDFVNENGGVRFESADKMANVYVCATMWHETDNEMKQMLTSILKLDEERAVNAAKKRTDTTQFRLEVHIYFDDAWEDQPELGRAPNEFFRTFFELINKMIDKNDDDNGAMPTKILVSTGYGGRLVVRLPAGTLLFVHLKDKKLIRHKKRWSQVMYMYYLLGHRIMDSHLSVEDRQLIADNTYILAIDGDSKFEPEAVLRLLNLMSTKPDIGCACGRIHPIGTGVMVWYQKFEYSIAHWFQKAAEHVFGCVLCAPGCFSLFRASALMDDNIMHKYTTTAKEPRHFVQYDQGEDRWLSTLLLKQGYRIEYAAASDAETYAPEGFNEFFNQRRRWTPSSVANTVDLLADYQRACANNACISRLYILYQFGVIGFSMLGPAIIFSMLVYAQVAAFHIAMTTIMMYNAIPLLLFILICFTQESNVQLFVAQILSIVYAFVMLAVIVATASQIVLETMFSPTSMFVVGMIAIFFFAACCHPKEFTNIIYGTVFFLMIPSTYVILSFYSLINLNVINWGTREAVAKATGKQVESTSGVESFIRRLMSGPFGFLFPSQQPRSDPEVELLHRKVNTLQESLDKLKSDEPNLENDPFVKIRNFTEKNKEATRDTSDLAEFVRGEEKKGELDVRSENSDLWMEAEYLQVCERGRLRASEQHFWDQLIDTYLKPIQSTAAENKAVADGLKHLRNNIAFAIILLNALMVLAIYLTQSNKDILAVAWMPHEDFKQFRWNTTLQEWSKESVPLRVEMLGLTIILALFGILLVQTAGLLIHRLNTVIGAFQEIQTMSDVFSTAPTKKDDDYKILDAARSMMATSRYWACHGTEGYTREAAEDEAKGSVLYRLQRARLATRLARQAIPDAR